MKKSVILFVSLILLTACGPAVDIAPDEEAAPVETEESAEAAVDLTGIWNGLLSHELVEGPCPSTPTQEGTVLIEQTGSTFTMQLSEGFDCDPLEACDFAGTVDGMNYSATNGGIADDEGGTYTTTLNMTAISDESVQAIGASAYELSAVRCEWTTSLSLTRGDEDDEVSDS